MNNTDLLKEYYRQFECKTVKDERLSIIFMIKLVITILQWTVDDEKTKSETLGLQSGGLS